MFQAIGSAHHSLVLGKFPSLIKRIPAENASFFSFLLPAQRPSAIWIQCHY